MSATTDKAKALLDIAITTYAEEIAPAVPKGKRYTSAMVANALGIAQRRLTYSDPDAALVKTLDAKDMASLAKSIRSGEITDRSHRALSEALVAYLEAELEITNPKYLARRKGA